jgi:serine phosphatase RsbU (regulator of sigma subunit)/ligand-binding sensor domain-containing protein
MASRMPPIVPRFRKPAGVLVRAALALLWVVPAAGLAAGPAVPLQQPPFQRITSEDGLSQMYVSAILQDRQGFLWVGTKDGLNRYDGRRFTVFHHIPFDPNSLSGDFITVLREDAQGTLWIGTAGSGVNRFDPDRERFVRICHQPGSPDDLGGDDISDIAFGKDGSVWVATAGNGLFHLKPAGPDTDRAAADGSSSHGYTCRHYRRNPGDPTSLGSDFIRALLVDSWGRLWVGSDLGLDLLVAEPGRSNGRDSFQRVPLQNSRGNALSVMAACEDQGGSLWLGTQDGLYQYQPDNGRLAHFPSEAPSLQKQLASLRVICATPADGTPWGGKLWLGFYGGLAIFDPASGTFAYPLHLKDDSRSPSAGSMISIFQDRGGVVWLGSNGYGLNKFDPMAIRFSHPEQYFIGIDSDIQQTRDLSVRSFALSLVNGEETLWIGARGIFQVNRQAGWFRRLIPPHPLGTGIVFSILAGDDGSVWFGTGQGLFGFDPAKETFRHYDTGLYDTGGGVDNRIFKVFRDRRGQLWVITSRTLGLFDPKSGRIRHYWYSAKPVHTSDEPIFPAVHEDRGGLLWLGTAVGLVVFDPATRSFARRYNHNPHDPHGLALNQIHAVEPDPAEPDRYLWLGTGGGGLDRLDRGTGRVTHFTEKDGLPNNCIYGILADKTGNLWLSTNQGLSVFDPRTRTCRNYDLHDGLQDNEFNGGAYLKSRQGELFFGGVRGYNAFFPENIAENHYAPPVVITDFLINNQWVGVHTPDSPLRKPVFRTEEIVLSHTDRVITFRFAALNFSNPEQIRYAFRMDNFDPDWAIIGPRQTATFTNLAPGEYVFRVKCANDDGIWNHREAAIRIVILPPPWKTWWAYTLMAAALVGALYGFRKYEIARLRLKHRLDLIHEEIRLASQIQLELMPKTPPVVAGYDIAGRSQPTRMVGGDYFDFIPMGVDQLAVCLGDVSGKGLPSALLMANLQATVRSQSHPSVSSRECIRRSNDQLVRNTDWGRFATLFYGILEPGPGRFLYCNAGHNPPLLVNGDGRFRRLETGGLIIGFAEDARYEEEAIGLAPGDWLVIHSDGITEARDEADEEFGEARLEELVLQGRGSSARQLIDHIFAEVARHAGKSPQTDDMTLVVIRRLGPEAGGDCGRPDLGAGL